MRTSLIDAGVRHPQIRRTVRIMRAIGGADEGYIPLCGTWTHQLLLERRDRIEVLPYCPERDAAGRLSQLVGALASRCHHALRVSGKTMCRIVPDDTGSALVSLWLARGAPV